MPEAFLADTETATGPFRNSGSQCQTPFDDLLSSCEQLLATFFRGDSGWLR